MKRENFVTLVMATIGGIFFALGMCMCMIEEWDAFAQGAVLGVLGLAILAAMLVVRRRMQGKPGVRLDKRSIGIVLLGIAGALLLGLGMCMTMVWEGLFAFGIFVGILGILALLGLIPACKGLK